ncbi:MAG TPA: DNA polymerase ligase N-terminal domain-containing protein [Gemmatimonadaceae bacterium]
MATRKRTTRKRTTDRSKPLAEYKAKRNFTKTHEPTGATVKRSRFGGRFVVQKHDATNLHFDFRLELDGVMKSWAVPKGPSYDPSQKRLAMQVEDHPMEYNSFEGTIPEGEYGAGTVMLWDTGTYEPEKGGGVDELRAGFERGDLKVRLHGKRLEGSWVLVKMRRGYGRAPWLLIKHRDEFADPDYDVVADEITSVRSGRTMDEIASGKRRVWRSSQRKPLTAKRASAKRTTTRKTARKTTHAKRST